MKKSLARKSLFLLCASVSLWLKSAQAVDHNNLDAGRPLEFDDAYSIAYGERALESGASVYKPQNGKAGLEGGAEFLYGFSKNSHFSLDFDPRYASDENTKRRLGAGDIGVGIFHNFNREYGSTPALAFRADAFLPTGRNSNGVDLRLRAIASRQFRQYARLHLNLDVFSNGGAQSGERRLQPGVILGYSQPLGFPKRFDRTLLAQFGYRANALKGDNGVATIGLGMRQQIGVQSVFDVGILSDLSGGSSREKLKLTAGYSRQF